MSVQLLQGDCLELMKALPDGSVQTCVTSPPYFGLRDYGCVGQIGLEPTPAAYVAALVAVFGEVWRVLKDDGTLWLNLGDSFSGSGRGLMGDGSPSDRGGTKQGTNRGTTIGQFADVQTNLKPKNLIGIPWRVAFALQSFGWNLRSDIIWHKPNPMPESVTDRPTKSHEYLFLLTKSERYYYDAAAIAEPAIKGAAGSTFNNGKTATHQLGRSSGKPREDSETRNRRTVWTCSTTPYKGAHFATFPPKLIEPCILAGSKAGDTVLDPFSGSGTTGAVAVEHGRNYIGLELNPEYIELSKARIEAAQSQGVLAIGGPP